MCGYTAPERSPTYPPAGCSSLNAGDVMTSRPSTRARVPAHSGMAGEVVGVCGPEQRGRGCGLGTQVDMRRTAAAPRSTLAASSSPALPRRLRPAGSETTTPRVSASPRVSVIVPSYNAERFLRAALDSALAQEGVSLEVLVADDGSTDGTSALLAGYGDRIRVLRQDHRGPAASRNAAAREARGEYVALLDADDRFRPGKLARQAAVL